MESGEEMRIEIQETVKRILEEEFVKHGLFEVFVKEEKTKEPIE
jgi:hypothetical protein